MTRGLLPCCVRTTLVTAGLAASVFVRADTPASVTPPPDDKVVKLPQVTVKDSIAAKKMESWTYARLGNFEFLSSASDTATKKLIKDLYEFHQAFGLLFPPVNAYARRPVTFVLCGQNKFQNLEPRLKDRSDRVATSFTRMDADQTVIAIDLAVREVNITKPGDSARVVIPGQPSSSATDTGIGGDTDDTSSSPVDTGGDSSIGGPNGTYVDQHRLLYREYAHYILGQAQPRMPAWLEEGLALMFSTVEIDKTQVSFAKLDAEFQDFFNKRALLSLPELFAITYDSPEYIQATGSTFPSQSLAFVHLCMYGHNKRYQLPFLKFIFRAAQEKPTEAMFREIFGMSTADMGIEIRSYVESGGYKYLTLKTAALQPAPDFDLRPATDAEMGRIKGDTLRLTKRLDDAHLELLSPELRGNTDARLLASIGELESEQNNVAAARKYFENAIAAKVDIPGPYIEIARDRLNDALKAAGPDGKLDARQMASVLTPLFAARQLSPLRVDLYLLIADAWEHSVVAPSEQNLEVLDEGAKTFSTHTDLVYKDAVLRVRNHLFKNASILVEYGLQVAANEPELKSKFEALKAELPPPAPAAPAEPEKAKH